MEWENYLELEPNQGLYKKNLLNMNENLGLNYPYINNDNNFNYFKKFLPNYPIGSDQEENNNKIYYYNLFNDIQNQNSELDNAYEKNYISPINYEESEEKKVNKLSSESLNNENKDNNKKKLFKTQTFSSVTKEESCKNKEISFSEDHNNSNNGINYLLPINERMKIKKQKTKKLLENKKKRDNLEEESKENILMNNEQEINMKNSLDKLALSKLSKKEIKMWRNRLSAQRSRDRRKKELHDLKIITKNLLQENQKLRNGIKERDNKINQLMNLLCPECKNKLSGNNQFEITIKPNNEIFNNSNNINSDKSYLTPSSIIGGKKKLALLMTGLFAIFCVFGSLVNHGENNLLRALKEKGGNKNKMNFDGEKRVNVPFLIEKDYSIRHKKEIEMYQKIKKNNLKNKNMMVPASLFTNNSEQIISNINQKLNNITNISNNSIIDEEKKEDDKNKMIEEKNNFLSKEKIKIIEKEYSSNANEEIKNKNDIK